MTHHVFWFPEADRRLLEILTASEEPSQLAEVVKKLDSWLSQYPSEIGESRYENERIAFNSPLAILYEILENPPTVVVLDVWTIK